MAIAARVPTAVLVLSEARAIEVPGTKVRGLNEEIALIAADAPEDIQVVVRIAIVKVVLAAVHAALSR